MMRLKDKNDTLKWDEGVIRWRVREEKGKKNGILSREIIGSIPIPLQITNMA